MSSLYLLTQLLCKQSRNIMTKHPPGILVGKQPINKTQVNNPKINRNRCKFIRPKAALLIQNRHNLFYLGGHKTHFNIMTEYNVHVHIHVYLSITGKWINESNIILHLNQCLININFPEWNRLFQCSKIGSKHQ